MVFMVLLQSVMKGTYTRLVVSSRDPRPQVDLSPNQICITSIIPIQAQTDAHLAHRANFLLVSGEIEDLTWVVQTPSPPCSRR